MCSVDKAAVVKLVYKWLKTTRLSIEGEDAKLVEEVVTDLLQFVFILFSYAMMDCSHRDSTYKRDEYCILLWLLVYYQLRKLRPFVRSPSLVCVVYPAGDSVQTGDITNWGQSPIGGCVFKQMSPLACLHSHIYTPSQLAIHNRHFPIDLEKISKYFFNSLGVIRGQGTQVQRQWKPGTLLNRGQSPIGGCVFKQMSPLVGVYKCHEMCVLCCRQVIILHRQLVHWISKAIISLVPARHRLSKEALEAELSKHTSVDELFDEAKSLSVTVDKFTKNLTK